MSTVDIPASLSAAGWDRQKTAMAKDKGVASKLQGETTKLADALKNLEKLHGAFDFGMLDVKGVSDAAAADAVDAKIDAAVKNLLGAAKLAGGTADVFAAAAEKLRKTVKGDSEKITVGAMGAAAMASKAADKFFADLKSAIDSAHSALHALSAKLKAGEKKGPGAAPASPKTVSDGKVLSALIKKCIASLKSPKGSPFPVRFLVLQENKKLRLYLGPKPDNALAKLKSQFDAKAKLKRIKDLKGTVIWEKASLTFVSDILKAGLAKQLQIAIREQTKLSVKVRIKKSDGSVDEGENVPDLKDDELKVDAADEAAMLAEQKDVAKRYAELQPQIALALKGKLAAKIKGPAASALSNVRAQKFAEASEDLDEIESLLEGDAEGDSDDDDGDQISLDGLRKARQAWIDSRHHAVSEVTELVKGLLAAFEGETAQRSKVVEAAGMLGAVSKKLNSAALDAQLDAALGEKDAAKRAQLVKQAKAGVNAMRKLLDDDKVIANLDHNEINDKMVVVKPMRDRLDEIEAALG